MKKIFEMILRHKLMMAVAILVIGGSGYYFYNKKAATSVENEIKTTVVKSGDIEVVINGSGQIQAKSQVDLKPQVAGDGLDIVQISVENNQLVKEGDLIAVLDNQEAREAVRNAQLSLSTAQIQYDEVAKEFDNKTEEESWKRQLAQNTVQQRSNALNDARKELTDYEIEAPFDGIVTGLNFEAGDSISRDEILASVITEKMQAEVSLNEIDAVKIKQGDSAILIFDVLGDQEIAGEVLKVDTIGEVNSGVVSYDVVVSFETTTELLKPGMSVEVDIEVESSKNTLIVPVAAINEGQKGGEYVLVVSDDSQKPERMIVETGITDDIYFEIISGLKEGDIVVSGQSSSGSAESGADAKKSLLQMGGGMGGGRPK